VAVALVLGGCGVSTSSDQATTSSGVPLPVSSQQKKKEQRLFDGYYSGLGEIGTLSHPKTPAARHKSIALNKMLSESCLPPGTKLYAPKVTPAQLERTRKQLEEGLPLALEDQGASAAQIRCVTDQIHSFPPVVVKKFTTDAPAAKQIMNAIYAKCRGAE
jgi:hypothetical protein